MKAFNHKCNVKARPFISVKVKPTIKDVNPNNLILHIGSNDLNSEKTSSQIARSIDLSFSLETNTNTIAISLITPQNDYLNSKASEGNIRLVNICGERYILAIGHSETIDPNAHLNKCGLHLYKFGIAFAKNISRYLLELN